MQFYHKRDHTSKTCYNLHGYPPNHAHHQANLVHKDSDSEPSWLFDFDASHHVTKDLANLFLTHEYTSDDIIVVAIGKGLPITHSGSTDLPTLSSPLHLNHVFYIHDISQS